MENHHIYYHQEQSGPRIGIKIEKNSKGYNWEVSVSGAESVFDAMVLIDRASQELTDRYGAPQRDGK